MSETSPAEPTHGIDEVLIDRLVRTFYGRVRADALLGPVFESRIDDWEPHLQRMCAFWSAVTLKSRRYQGQPMALHQRLPVDGRHFDRWLQLFARTAGELCPPAAAAVFIEASSRIAESLELGIAVHHGVMLRRGERLHRPDAELMIPTTKEPA